MHLARQSEKAKEHERCTTHASSQKERESVVRKENIKVNDTQGQETPRQKDETAREEKALQGKRGSSRE